MDIKPIETVYNGYRFRSRLEARWAVFFDAMGIKYEYEKQGYVLSKKTCYLPDFYLPSLNTFVEVKPRDAFKITYNPEIGCYQLDCAEPEKTKLDDVITKLPKGNNCCLLLVGGDPYEAFPHMNEFHDYVFGNSYIFYEHDKKNGIAVNTVMFVYEFNDGYSWVVPEIPECKSDELRICNIGNLMFSSLHNNASDFDEARGQWKKIEDAGLKARQARFEHGETPTGGIR